MNAQPAKHFAFGPYKAEAIGPYEWWGVKNKNGLNVLTFADRPGHVFTLEAEAKNLADEWNNGKVFEYPPEPVIVPRQADPVHDARFGKYVRTQYFNYETKRWTPSIVVKEGQTWAEAVDEYVET